MSIPARDPQLDGLLGYAPVSKKFICRQTTKRAGVKRERHFDCERIGRTKKAEESDYTGRLDSYYTANFQFEFLII